MARILVFDSGLGSLLIARAIYERAPWAKLDIVIDNDYFPYGEKPDEVLIKRILSVLARATEVLNPDCIVLACNTASTIALDQVREAFSLPVIGVVPAIKPAAELTQSGVIGLIATPATIGRDYTRQLITDFAPHCDVILQGSTELVQLAEDFVRDPDTDLCALDAILQPFAQAHEAHSLDQLVLGCTHFPILKQAIEARLSGVNVIDSSDAIGRQVERVIQDLPGVTSHLRCQSHSYDSDTLKCITMTPTPKATIYYTGSNIFEPVIVSYSLGCEWASPVKLAL